MASFKICIASLAALVLLPPAKAAQPSAPAPIPAPLRELQWGNLNFLHTTDTHGWHAGHLQQPSYSADWGDYISFVTHMRRLADSERFDLLLVDTGDRIEGNGLYDASDPKGKYTFDIFKQQHIDIICSGNHELYKASSSEDERQHTVPNFQDNYIASNLDIINPQTGEFEPLAPRVRKFTTKNQGIRITAFGFLYAFQGNAKNTRVRPIQDAITHKWFQDAIKDRDTDLFVVAGHVPADSEEYTMIFNAIRQQNWDTPIQFFGGHLHVRDFKKLDNKASAIASGRYMETIGFLSLDGVKAGGNKHELAAAAAPKVRRKYIDNNLFSLHHHSLTNASTFDTELGKNVTAQIAQARKDLNLDTRHGCAPKDLWIDRVAVDHEDSVFNWLGTKVLPDSFHGGKNDSNSNPKLVLTNTGAVRFDIFKGPFTIDSTFLVSPFDSGFRQIKNVDVRLAKKVLRVLNEEAPILANAEPRLDPSLLVPPEQLALRRSGMIATSHADIIPRQEQIPLAGAGRDAEFGPKGSENYQPQLFPGYTTRDDLGDDGDDTLHSPITYVFVPNCIQSKIDFPADESTVQKVDVVYNEFIELWVVLALKFLGVEVEGKDTESFGGEKTMTNVISEWVEGRWPCEE